MKRKIFRISIALVLVLSFSLVTAVPVIAAADGTLAITEDYVASGGSISITVTDSDLNASSGVAETLIARVISGTEGTSSVAAEAIGNAVTTHTTAASVDPDAGADENQIAIDDFTLTAGTSGVTSIISVSRNTNGTVDVTFDQATSDGTATIAYTSAETALLTETDVNTGVFTGTLGVNTSNAVGTLHVSDGDTITASYYDADNTNRTGNNEDTATADTVAPVYDTAKTGDSATGDSSVKNKIYLKFTETGSGLDSGTIVAGDFSVTNPARTVTGIDTVGTDYVILTLDSDLLTDAVPTVDLKSGESVADAVGNLLNGLVTKTASDGLKPEVVSAVAEDTAGNGYLDKITLTLSETLTNNQPTAAGFSVTGSQSATLTVGSVGAGGGVTTGGLNFTSAGTTVIAELSNNAGKTGIPTLTYTSGESIEVKDSAGNALATVSPTVTDSAKPTIMDLDIYDTTADGKIDKIIVTFSEYIDTDDSAAPVAADFGTIKLPDNQTAVLSAASFTDPAGVADAVTITGITGQVTLNTAAGSTGISDDLSSNWVDVNTNTLVTTLDDEAVTDSAAPVFKALETVDADADGKIEDLQVTFSESITTDIEGADFSIASANSLSGSLAGTFTDSSPNDAIILLNVTESAYDTDATPTVTYTASAGVANSIKDSTANTMLTATSSAATDAAIPVIIDREAQLGSAKVAVTFSEGVYAVNDGTGALVAADFAYVNASGGGATTLSSVSHIAGGDIAVLTLNVQTIAADTSGTPDTIAAASTAIYDLVGQAAATTAVDMLDAREALSLVDGWNLVSIPKVASAGWDIATSNATGTFLSIITYDSGSWSSVTDADSLDAVFINASGPQELTLSWTTSEQAVPPTKALEAGWNLLGANMDLVVDSSVRADYFLDSVYGSYSTLFSPGYNLLTSWTVTTGTITTKDVFPFEGYWLYMTAADELAGRTS